MRLRNLAIGSLAFFASHASADNLEEKIGASTQARGTHITRDLVVSANPIFQEFLETRSNKDLPSSYFGERTSYNTNQRNQNERDTTINHTASNELSPRAGMEIFYNDYSPTQDSRFNLENLRTLLTYNLSPNSSIRITFGNKKTGINNRTRSRAHGKNPGKTSKNRATVTLNYTYKW